MQTIIVACIEAEQYAFENVKVLLFYPLSIQFIIICLICRITREKEVKYDIK